MPECVIATLFDWYAHIIWWSTTRRGCSSIGSRAIDRRFTYPYGIFSVLWHSILFWTASPKLVNQTPITEKGKYRTFPSKPLLCQFSTYPRLWDEFRINLQTLINADPSIQEKNYFVPAATNIIKHHRSLKWALNSNEFVMLPSKVKWSCEKLMYLLENCTLIARILVEASPI